MEMSPDSEGQEEAGFPWTFCISGWYHRYALASVVNVPKPISGSANKI